MTGFSDRIDSEGQRVPPVSIIRKWWADNPSAWLNGWKPSDDPSACWACDSEFDRQERAHIRSLVAGGSNHPSNLHLLCHVCHVASEQLQDADYWWWIQRWSADDAMLLRSILLGAIPTRFLTVSDSYLDVLRSKPPQYRVRMVEQLASQATDEEREQLFGACLYVNSEDLK